MMRWRKVRFRFAIIGDIFTPESYEENETGISAGRYLYAWKRDFNESGSA